MTEPTEIITYQVLHRYGPQACGGVAFETRRIHRIGESYADVAIVPDPHKPLTCNSCGRAVWAGDMVYATPETHQEENSDHQAI